MAGTINLANVAIGFDVRQLQKGTEFSRAELRTLTKVVQDSVSPVDRYNRELMLLEKAHSAGAISADRLNQAIGSLREKYKIGQAGQVANSSNGITNDLKSTLAQYAGMAAAFAGVKKSLSLAATAESNKISLEVLTGSAAKAQMLFEGFVDLDRNSPLSRSEFSKAAQALIGYGYAAEKTLPTLENLSQVSMGNADKLQSLSLAFGQVQANGKLMGQEVLQMINAGFNPLQEISRTTGRSMSDLKAAMEKGAISAGMVEDAFKSATSEGGRFHGMNERLKESAAGQWSKIQSDVEMLSTEIGTNLLPATKAFMDLLNSGADSKGEGSIFANLAKALGTGLEGAIAIGSDAFTNLDGNAKGTKFSSLQDRLQTEQMQKQLELEHLHVQTKEEKERVAAAIAKRMAKEREEIEAIAKKEKEVEEEKKKADKEAKAAAKADAALKKQLQKEAATEAEQAFDRLIKEADKRKKEVETPLEAYTREFTRLQDLFREGLISEETFKRGKAGALNDSAIKAEKDINPNKIADTIAPALRAGSVEAYKFLLQQKEDAAQFAREQVDISRDSLEVQKQQLETLKAHQAIGRAR